jgi:hypothetical protein
MHKTKYRKRTRARPPGVKFDPKGGKSKFLGKNGYNQQHKTTMADIEDTCHNKFMKVGNIEKKKKKCNVLQSNDSSYS